MGLSFERFKADSHSTLNIELLNLELSTPGQDFRCCDKWNYKKVALGSTSYNEHKRCRRKSDEICALLPRLEQTGHDCG